MARLKEKEDFVALTDKQKAIVNTKAKHPEYGPQKLAEEASKQLDGDESVSVSYVSPILNNYSDIIRTRREQLDNERHEGEQKTVGDPFADTLSDNNQSKGWQGIKERPTKGKQKNTDNEITVRLTERDMQKLINQDVLDEFDRVILNRVLEPQFESNR